MAKTAERIDTVEFPTFDASKATEQLRTFAEKSVEQSKEAYAKIKTGTEEAQKVFETTYDAVKSAGSELSMKTINAMRANTDAGFNHLEAIVAAKSFSELLELQTAFLRKSFETVVEQGKDFQTTAQKAAEDVAKPVKGAFEKAVKDLKVA